MRGDDCGSGSGGGGGGEGGVGLSAWVVIVVVVVDGKKIESDTVVFQTKFMTLNCFVFK